MALVNMLFFLPSLTSAHDVPAVDVIFRFQEDEAENFFDTINCKMKAEGGRSRKKGEVVETGIRNVEFSSPSKKSITASTREKKGQN